MTSPQEVHDPSDEVYTPKFLIYVLAWMNWCKAVKAQETELSISEWFEKMEI